MTTLRKLWAILPAAQRRQVWGMIALMLFGMVLETLGVGLVIPALSFMSQADAAASFPAFEPVLTQLGRPSQRQLMVGGVLLLVSVFVVKTAFLSYVIRRQNRFTADLQIDLSHRLFTAYMRQPYTFHLQRNSAELIRNVSGEVSQFAASIGSALIILTEGMVVLGVVALLIAVQPVGTFLVIGVLAFGAWLFQTVLRRRIVEWGAARQVHEGLRIQHLLQGFGAVKDLKVLGREAEFLSQFQRHNTNSSRINERQKTLQELPRLFLELLAAIGLALIVLVMLRQGAAPSEILPTLGLFAAGAFRILPSANRVLGSVQHVRFSIPVLDLLAREFQQLEADDVPSPGARMAFDSVLTLERVTFSYANTESPSLQGVDVAVRRGTTVGFVGKTGSGKSTLVDVMLGLLKPADGAVRVDGVDIQTNLRGWQNQIGYVPQSIYLTDDTLGRNVAFGLAPEVIDEASIWRALTDAQMADFVRELPDGLHTIVGERGVRLSGGQRQRIGIARALYHDPAVLVLDEATSSLDAATERDLMAAIGALHGQKTIVIVAHRLSTVAHCDYLYRLERGRIAAEGTPDRVLDHINAHAT